MIDLHIHTTYSDGADSLIDVLKQAEYLKLKYISITDHDNCKAYKELKQIDVNKYYTGKIIPGIEIKVGYKGRLIEVLGYKFNTDKMQEWSDEYYKDKSKKALQQKYFDITYDRCKEMGLILSEKEKIDFNPEKNWASLTIYNELKKHKENQTKLPADMLETFDTFSKKYCGDVNNKLYIDKTKDYPTVEEAISIIKKCGGLVFLPHLFIYKWAEDKKRFIDEILDTFDIDGVECMHSEFSQEQIDYLIKLADERGYFKSGGSDYHGKNKVGIYLAKGKGNLKIPEEFVKEWE